jgi:hypothetical protein
LTLTLRSGLTLEVRRACRDELRVVYGGASFDEQVWAALGKLGTLEVLAASRLNPRMKDVMRVRGAGFRLEGALAGPYLHAFFSLPSAGVRRHRVQGALEAAVRPFAEG